jgi:hypothetical protein
VSFLLSFFKDKQHFGGSYEIFKKEIGTQHGLIGLDEYGECECLCCEAGGNLHYNYYFTCGAIELDRRYSDG